MTQVSVDEKFKRATGIICKQGMVQFPVSDTAVTIIKKVVGEHVDELDLIYAFRDAPSQTDAQLMESSGMAAEKIQELATSLAKKGLIFNQPNSAGIMVYRILPLMMDWHDGTKTHAWDVGSAQDSVRRKRSPSKKI